MFFQTGLTRFTGLTSDPRPFVNTENPVNPVQENGKGLRKALLARDNYTRLPNLKRSMV
jgi:hypothetical protein